MRFLVALIAVIISPILCFAEPEIFSKQDYIGNIAGKYEIAMVLYPYPLQPESNRSELFGYYYYTKNKIPIFVKGYMDGDNFYLSEYLENGKENALFKGKIEIRDIKGKWIINKKELPFTLSRLIMEVQNFDTREVDIDENEESCLNQKCVTENLTTSGSIFISKGEKEFDYIFSFDLCTINEPIHFGNTEGLLKLHISGPSYFEANPEAKDMSENCILFFIFFSDRIFVYEYGEPSYLDFGMGVHAEGVYLRK